MTLYTIEENGRLVEYHENGNRPDKKKLDILTLIEKNPESILKKAGALLIGKEITIANNQTFDLLAIDEQGNSILFGVMQGESNRDGLIRLIEKAAMLDQMGYDHLNKFYQSYVDDPAAEMKSAHFDLFGNDIETWNQSTRIIMVAKAISDDVSGTAGFFRKNGLNISCVEFKYFVNDEGLKMVSREFIVGGEHKKIQNGLQAALKTSESEKDRFFSSLDNHGKAVFKQLFDFASELGFGFRWTSNGFSLNVVVDGQAIGLCYGYAPDSLLNQSIYTSFDQIIKKVANGEEVVSVYRAGIEKLDFFTLKRSGYRWEISKAYSEKEARDFFEILKEVADLIRQNDHIGIASDANIF